MKVNITGIKELNQALSKYKKTRTDKLRDEINKSVLNVERNTKRTLVGKVDRSLGRLVSSYHNRPATGSKLQGDVFSNLFYAPFIEFGTGTEVFNNPDYDFTAEEKQYASQFKRGPGRNMPARPALFPSWDEERPKFIKNVEEVLK